MCCDSLVDGVSEAVPSPKLTNCNHMETGPGNNDDMSAAANLRTETSFAHHIY
jgi:hypothetical protein